MRRVVSAAQPEAAPPVDWKLYVQFARKALSALADGDHPDAVILREQLSEAVFTEIDYTGVGFFLSLDVPPDSRRLSRSGVIGDLHAQGPNDESPLGILLFVKEGLAVQLEVFAHGDWPHDLGRYNFQYVRWVRRNGNHETAESVSHRDFASMWSD